MSDRSNSLTSWDCIRVLRNTLRVELRDQRKQLSHGECCAASAAIVGHLHREALVPDGAYLSFYWPLPGEIDLRPFIRSQLKRIAAAALPVVIGQNQPMEFWQWQPRTKLCSRGLWGVPAPAERDLVFPTVILVPLLGFDNDRFRLSHGGGYYDRTLSTLKPKPLTIGIGYESSRRDTIYPNPQDIAMDVVVTETGLLSL